MLRAAELYALRDHLRHHVPRQRDVTLLGIVDRAQRAQSTEVVEIAAAGRRYADRLGERIFLYHVRVPGDKRLEDRLLRRCHDVKPVLMHRARIIRRLCQRAALFSEAYLAGRRILDEAA